MAYAIICNIDLEKPNDCLDKFSKFLRQFHFLEDVGSYVYRLEHLSDEEVYMKQFVEWRQGNNEVVRRDASVGGSRFKGGGKYHLW